MIAPKTVAEVRRLLTEGELSQRKIAGLTGVSRGTVAAIASGRRPDYDTLSPRANDPDEPTGPAERCPGCGGMVYLPCRLCLVRSKKNDQRRLCNTGSANGTPRNRAGAVEEFPLTNLRPEHHARYEQVRAEKERQERLEVIGIGE